MGFNVHFASPPSLECSFAMRYYVQDSPKNKVVNVLKYQLSRRFVSDLLSSTEAPRQVQGDIN